MNGNKLITFLFSLSVIVILALTLTPSFSRTGGGHHFNLIPFYNLINIVFTRGVQDILINIAGNVFLFVPFGFLLPSVITKVNKASKAIFIGFLFSLLIECLQIIVPNRWSDIDDIILNTVGTALGYKLLFYVKKLSISINNHVNL